QVSVTTDTLARLAAEGWERSQLFFITGADAFAEIATWRHYPALLDQAHFVVVSRAGRRASSLRAEMPSLADRMRDVSPGARGAGVDTAQPAVWLIDADTPDVSATRIRQAVAE